MAYTYRKPTSSSDSLKRFSWNGACKEKVIMIKFNERQIINES